MLTVIIHHNQRGDAVILKIFLSDNSTTDTSKIQKIVPRNKRPSNMCDEFTHHKDQ